MVCPIGHRFKGIVFFILGSSEMDAVTNVMCTRRFFDIYFTLITSSCMYTHSPIRYCHERERERERESRVCVCVYMDSKCKYAKIRVHHMYHYLRWPISVVCL